MSRFLDIILSVAGLVFLSPVLFLLIIIGFFDTGSPIFLQKRVGKDKNLFTLIKLRTMRRDTPSLPSHLNTPSAVTRYGQILRKTKLDELPQLWNVVRGDMSLVGPRPNLPSQKDLIATREKLGVYSVRPGITGLAQVKNIDMSNVSTLARVDAEMIRSFSTKSYIKYILMTVIGHGRGDAVKLR